MANDTQLTIIGNLGADPELRYTQGGTPVASFRVGSTPRSYDKNTGQFKDGETLWLNCTVWREYAENVAESLQKGMQVIVYGRLVQRSYTPRDGGEQRTVFEMQVEEVGPTLRFATAQVQRAQRSGGGQTYQPQGSQAPQASPYDTPATDPWAAPPTASTGANFDAEPPF